MEGYEAAYLVELKKSADEMVVEVRCGISKIEKIMDGYTAKMDHMNTVLEAAEETLLNVLVAIRQQEHLQAWYPAQKGFTEMNVVGRHPSKYL